MAPCLLVVTGYVIRDTSAMRNIYRGYHPPTVDELNHLWGKAFFAFDANVLLNLYRLRRSVDYLWVFEQLQKRIWLPHQAGLEYHKNRIPVVKEMYYTYDNLLKDITSTIHTLKSKYTRHPYIEFTKTWAALDVATTEIEKLFENAKKDHPNLAHEDPVRDRLAELFEGRVGPPFAPADLEILYKEAAERYAKGIPPGYKDSGTKPEPERYGDYLLWRQVCAEAETRKQPVILVTDERKGDWWSKHDGKTLGPCPELVAEIWDRSKVNFHMYSSEQFLKFAGEHLQRQQELSQVTAEAKSLREEEERRRHAMDRARKHFLVKTEEVYERSIEKLQKERSFLRNHIAAEEMKHEIARERMLTNAVSRAHVEAEEIRYHDAISRLNQQLSEVESYIERENMRYYTHLREIQRASAFPANAEDKMRRTPHGRRHMRTDDGYIEHPIEDFAADRPVHPDHPHSVLFPLEEQRGVPLGKAGRYTSPPERRSPAAEGIGTARNLSHREKVTGSLASRHRVLADGTGSARPPESKITSPPRRLPPPLSEEASLDEQEQVRSRKLVREEFPQDRTTHRPKRDKPKR